MKCRKKKGLKIFRLRTLYEQIHMALQQLAVTIERVLHFTSTIDSDGSDYSSQVTDSTKTYYL